MPVFNVPVFFKMPLEPLVPTMRTFVRVLKLFNVDDYWSAFIDPYPRHTLARGQSSLHVLVLTSFLRSTSFLLFQLDV